MYAEKYLCENINGLHYFLNRFVIFNKNVLVPLDHLYEGKFDSPHLHILF